MGYGLRVIGYGLWVKGYGLKVMGYRLWVIGYGLEVTGYRLWVKVSPHPSPLFPSPLILGYRLRVIG